MRSRLAFVFIFIACFNIQQACAITHAKNEIDIVFCIDMSGSTNGLVPDMKSKICNAVNGIYRMRPYPNLRIGIIGFSRPSFGKNNSFVKILCPLTNEFDQVVYELASLKPSIEKGDQYVSAALEMAGKMNWSSQPKALRIIYLMGNGTVSAGGSAYRQICERLLQRNIFVNSIYCIKNKLVPSEVPGWKFISDNTGGQYYTYKISCVSPVGRPTGDAMELMRMNEKLNRTYVYFGKDGKKKMLSLLDEDRNSLAIGPVNFYSRVLFKTADYNQSSQSGWDLVNYVKIAGSRFQTLDRKLLPDSIRVKSNEELAAMILSKKDERVLIIKDIRSYLTAIGQDTLRPDSSSLEGIIVGSVFKLARDKGFPQDY